MDIEKGVDGEHQAVQLLYILFLDDLHDIVQQGKHMQGRACRSLFECLKG